jgi:hypothetical protein
MAYFSNGTAGEAFYAEYCSGCVHNVQEGGGCSVWLLHMLHNYQECNKPDSFLHVLIPRNKDGLGNQACTMYLPSLNPQVYADRCPVCKEPYHGAMCGGRPIADV